MITAIKLKSKFVCRDLLRHFSSKVFPSSASAVLDVNDGSSILLGGFGLCGIPENLIKSLNQLGSKNLTIIGNDVGCDDTGPGLLLDSKQVSKVITSYVGEYKQMSKLYNSGQIELHLNPQGTLAERIRCGGAGIPAFYTPAGVGTLVQEGSLPIKYNTDGSVSLTTQPKESRVFDSREYLLEEAITADFAFVKAWKGDSQGNLVFRSTARNLNPDCAKAARVSIAEVEELVEVGTLQPDEIHLPGIYVDRIVVGEHYEKHIERLKHSEPSKDRMEQDMRELPPPSQFSRQSEAAAAQMIKHHNLGDNGVNNVDVQLAKTRIARRAALEFRDGMNVNIGIGIPTLACNFIPPNVTVTLQSENGLLGMGPYPLEGHADADLVNASKEPVTYLPGSSIFSTSDSFAMIRGRHIDLTILGALELSATGDLASWIIPGGALKGMGGAMDLLSGCSNIVATMQHTNKYGKSKILEKCSLPLTGKGVIKMIITELAVFTVDKADGLTLIEHAEGVTVEEIKQKTAASFHISESLCVMKQ